MHQGDKPMKCPVCSEEIYNTYLCTNCGHDCEDGLEEITEITPIMNPRLKIARDLLQADLIDSYHDYSEVARNLENGKSKDEILYSAVVEKWPGVFAFLKERL
jgi:primosomal protein N'